MAVASTALAAPEQGERVGPEQIAAAARAFLQRHSSQLSEKHGNKARVDFTVQRLDSRLNMAPCPKPLSTSLRSNNEVGRVNVQVRCDSQVQWALYVPAEINLYRPVVTLRGPVSRGTKLAASDVELRETDVSLLHGEYFTAVEDVVGMEAKRLLQADQTVVAAHLQPPLMVERGDAVILTASGDGLTVKMPGVALRDGHRGQQISVRNTQSDRVVEAEVIGPGQVKVPM